MEQLEVVCPANAQLLLHELAQQGYLLTHSHSSPAARPPALLMGRRRVPAAVPTGGASRLQPHYYPLLASCFVVAQQAQPLQYVHKNPMA